MKALAAEMVENFGKRLKPLGISVKEYTGDMQLTKTEILNTQVSRIKDKNILGSPFEIKKYIMLKSKYVVYQFLTITLLCVE